MKLGIALICIGTGVAIERGMMLTIALSIGDPAMIIGAVIGTILFAFLPIYFGIRRIMRARQRSAT